MGRLLSLGLEFMGRRLQTLIRVNEQDTGIEYLVTLLDAGLEELLKGDNIIIVEKDNCLQLDLPVEQNDQWILKKQIVHALGKYLKKTRIFPADGLIATGR